MTEAKTNELPAYLFHQGTNYRAYEYLGVHKEGNNVFFRVWAPNADAVFLVGDFNGWQDSSPMERATEGGVWETVLKKKEFPLFSKYKFKILHNGKAVYKADPYGRYAEIKPDTASVYFETEGFSWEDKDYIRRRKKNAASFYDLPINIYELHLGSFRRHDDGSYYSYRETADVLVPYVKEMGYTHVELMPIAEHPFDGSWGYQVCGYYAPTSRFGTPHDFMYLINELHKADIGVILDWVPAHFPKDAHGLYEFDGTATYEFQGEDRKEHKSWGTRCFDIARNEVQCFLVSNVIYLAEQYHIDGIRVDAVASMLYLDYDRKPGEWNPNCDGGNISYEAVAFFRKLNSIVKGYDPSVLMIAEESTAFADITRFDRGGLGFDLKWNMGWMNDALSYVGTDPLFRKGNHDKITFPLCYAFSERYVLPISHDEVVHGKHSLLDKMPGSYEEKFAGARLFFAYMMTMPGKKLSFMGNEFGQFSEWCEERQLDWMLLGYEKHEKLRRYVAELNHLYKNDKRFYEDDSSWNGFNWLVADDGDNSVFAYERKDKSGNSLIAALNFTPVERKDYLIPVEKEGSYKVVLFSDSVRYGGERKTPCRFRTVKKKGDGRAYLKINLPPLTAIYLELEKN